MSLNTNQIQKVEPAALYQNEDILVIKRDILFREHPAWHGIIPYDPCLLEKIDTFQEYHNRNMMENDPCFKQIIPYFIFRHESSLFLMQRRENASEKRLGGKFTLGIGGHIRKEDVQGKNIIDWGLREFAEEINYDGTYDVTPFGIINDDTTSVGQVHIGLVYVIDGFSPNISIKDEMKWGELVNYETCRNHYDCMEAWSQMVFDELYKK